MKLQDIINEEINSELADIRYKQKLNVPMEFIIRAQTKVHALQWVIELIEAHGTKGNFELDDISLENSRAERN